MSDGAQEAANNETANAAAQAAAVASQNDNGQVNDGGSVNNGNDQTADAFAGVEDQAQREWMSKVGVNDVKALATKAYETDKLIGSAIQLPAKDADEETWSKFYTKLGRPEAADGYEFNVPEALPDHVPYSEETATEFKGVAHKLGLNPAQAAGLHDWFAGKQVDLADGTLNQAAETVEQTAVEQKAELAKVWGPLDGQSAKANAEFADKALSAAGDPALISDLQKAGFLGPNKEVLNAKFAVMMSTLGAALYKEDNVLQGDPTAIGNPFDEKSPNFNLTKAMQIYKADPDQAKTLIFAAGKQPGDFGIAA